MLLSAVIPLTATNTPEEKAYLGRACYALSLSLVERANPFLAAGPHGLTYLAQSFTAWCQ